MQPVTDTDTDTELDARGLDCPLPILRAKQAFRQLPGGAVLQVLATDPGARQDFSAFCRQGGYELLDALELDGEYRFRIRKPLPVE